MKPINSRVHGVLDYLTGATLIFAPAILDFASSGAAARVPLMLGIGTIIYSALTRYELGLVKVIPFRGHLTLDLFSGILLAASPWLFGFAEHVWKPHVLLGAFEIVVTLLTRASSSTEGSRLQRTPAH
jgi:hypothetical protein